jgi:hypothetical protein
LLTFAGSGRLNYALIYGNNGDAIIPRIYVDGVRVEFNYTFSEYNTLGFTASTPGISLLAYAAGSGSVIFFTGKFPFKRKLEVKAYNKDTSTNYIAWANAVVELTS